MILKSAKGPNKLSVGHWATKGLASLWLFNEGSGNIAKDLSGNNNTGTLLGGDVTWVASKHGVGLNFPGTVGDYVSVADKAILNLTTKFTIIVGFKRNSVDVATNLYDAGGGQALAEGWGLTIGADDQPNFFEPNVDNNFFDSTINDLLHHQIAVVKIGDAGTNVFFYIDGVPDGDAAVGVIGAATGVKFIGENRWFNHCNGIIEYVYFYNCDFSASEIALISQEPFCMFERDPIELWVGSIGAGAPPGTILPQIINAYMKVSA